MIYKFFSVAALALLSAQAFATDVDNDPDVQWEVNSFEITDNNNQRTTPFWKRSEYSVSPYAQTEVVLENKGGYVAQLQLEYQTLQPNGSTKVYVVKSDWITTGKDAVYKIPFQSSHLKVTAVRKTGLAWSPVRAIVSKNICEYNNPWHHAHRSINIVKLDVWGTTLHPKWKFMQAKDTYDNGADTSKACANY